MPAEPERHAVAAAGPPGPGRGRETGFVTASSGSGSGLRPLAGLQQHALREALAEAGVPVSESRMRASQIWSWLYVRGATRFDAMTDISKARRAEFAERFDIARPAVAERQVSGDGTRKYVLEFRDGARVEAVYIPEPQRGTLCVSSQVGCTLNCSFCHTGTQRLVRNLTAGEIVAQLLVCRDDLDLWPGPGEMPAPNRTLSNVVLMGMGEPLYNFENVRDACAIISDGDGIGISRRRITLSTSGVVPMIPRAGEEIRTQLAVSLHAATDDVRNRLVPINRKWNIASLLDACRAYPGAANSRRITFEYAMLDGVNDSDADARGLVRLLAGIPAKVNLIPFNPWPGAPYTCSPWRRIEAFAAIVNRSGYSAPIRMPRGRDILAACGQLKSETERAVPRRAPKKRQIDAVHTD